MSDEPAPTDSPDTRESFVLDDIDEAVTEEAIDHTLDSGAGEATVSREEVETEIMGDIVEYFESVYEPEALGIDAPTEAAVRQRWFDFDYLEEYDLVSWRWSRRPYSYTAIVYDPAENEHRYHVDAPTLTEFEQYVREDLTRILRQDLMHRDIGAEEERDEIFELEVQRVFDEHAAAVPPAPLLRILYYLRRDFVRYGKIDPLMGDPAIEDISCDGVDVPLFVYHGAYRDLETNLSFTEARLDAFVTRLAQRAGKSLTAADPLLDASLPDGSRAQFTLGSDISLRGSTFTIRRFSEDPFTPTDLIDFETFSLDQMAYLWLLVENGKSVVFAGGTGSGKTTSLNAISYFIPPGNKIVSIEDTPELRLPHENWVRNVTRSSSTADGQGAVTMFDLLESALRQRPEFLLVGEIRANPQVAFTFFQAISTGHTAYTTFHADSAEGAMRRLENEPLNIPRQMIGSLDVVSIQRQVTKGPRRVRRNHKLVELTPAPDADGGVRTRDVFGRDPASDSMEQRAPSALLQEIKYERGWDDRQLRRELSLRREVLRYLLREDIRHHESVGRVIHTFYRKPQTVLEQIRADELDPADLPAQRSE
ncbi:type II/IV secretion system ATPase subunit [Halosimplex aquaticum]|uniref:Type II/IV secretion system ATPase subunit n=1 Tax=Halosimplex aquaticum TaxID=3026162 RepID=A0ABD5XZK1_9EURY|nr:type II/IV secretion system ATPase subunit [Halosimplex aquaticum]